MDGKKTWVAAIDVGALHCLGFGWPGHQPRPKEKSKKKLTEENRGLSWKLAGYIAEECRQGHKVALGLECPLWIPLWDDTYNYTVSRRADSPLKEFTPHSPPDYRIFPTGDRCACSLGYSSLPWSAGPGAMVAMAGMAFVRYFFNILRQVFEEKGPDLPVICTSPETWDAGKLLIWEAFVSNGPPKQGDNNPHDEDAWTAWKAFDTLYPLWAKRPPVPRFFLEWIDNPLTFAYIEKETGDPGKWASLLKPALQAANWPPELLLHDDKLSPLIIRSIGKRWPSSAAADPA